MDNAARYSAVQLLVLQSLPRSISDDFRQYAAEPCKGFSDPDNMVPGERCCASLTFCSTNCRLVIRSRCSLLVESGTAFAAACRYRPVRPHGPPPADLNNPQGTPPPGRVRAGPAAGQGRLLLRAPRAARADGAGGGLQDHREGQAQGVLAPCVCFRGSFAAGPGRLCCPTQAEGAAPPPPPSRLPRTTSRLPAARLAPAAAFCRTPRIATAWIGSAA